MLSKVRFCSIMLFGLAGCASLDDNNAPATANDPDVASLRAADAGQQQAVVAGSISRIQEIMHLEYRVNAPPGRVMTRAEVILMFHKGMIAAEPVVRTEEAAIVSGTTGIVMGRETLVPRVGSPLAKTSDGRPILRRFTNIDSFERGKWWFIGRHFNQVVP